MKPTKARFAILALISIATMINYLDRSVMGVANSTLSKDLDISPATMGVILSAFGWTYALAQIPGGVALDRIGTRLTYSLSLGLWSLATAFHGLMSSVAGLVSARLALGLAEAPCFPANSRILSTWFPQTERATATGVYTVGEYIGLGLLIPLLSWIMTEWGWRSLFYLVGALGVAFAFVFFALYRDPEESKSVNQAELDLITAGGGATDGGTKMAFSWANVGRLMSKRQIAGASLAQFCSNSTLVFFLTWFPKYLVDERHMSFIKQGFTASLPYIAAAAGVMLGGIVSDWLIRKTGSPSIGRKAPIIAGLLLCATMIGANYTDSNGVVIVIMSIAFFGQGLAGLGWTLLSDVAPKSALGLAGGVFNFCANLASIVTPIVIGIIVQKTGSFGLALTYVGVLGLIGALSYIFIVGPVERVNIDDPLTI
jgi:MFS transporter, ACS family, D-galactonate transporter